jgi:outer membrane protein assembly factor BamA
VGNHKVSSSTLAEEIRTKEFPFLGSIGLGEGGFATPRQIELDVQSLVDYYESIGRPGTKVRAEIAPAPGSGGRRPRAPRLSSRARTNRFGESPTRSTCASS